MEFKRKITSEMQLWKESLRIKKKALVIKGLRQIGKSYIVNQFAKENYNHVIKIDFKKESNLKVCFDSD
ncbi:MAG: AAA family ATPase, partial [Candidatus Enterosoma sp.]|nr:AAA family ATPase [Candidatus Enterosoma sp.]